MNLTFRLVAIRLVNGAIDVDVTTDDFELDPSHPPDPNPQTNALPNGFASDPAVGFSMLLSAVNEHGLDPVGVQGHGQQIVDALNDTWPGLNAYVSPSDAVVWPGFGSLDVTINSGLGGWQFRPDGVTPYRRDH
jgi:hypothetical protein